MYKKLLNFIKYNNAFTLIILAFFFSFGVTFAANPDVRESVYSSEETVISVDNGLIVSADLDNFNFNLRISSITEDEKNYYTTYTYQALIVEDGIWQSKEIEKVLTVNKEALGGKDLGLYLARDLGENINYELSYLKRVQKLEREKGESQKVVTVEYSGLIGKLLDPEEKVIEGYDPVIPEPVVEVPATVESNPAAVIISTPYSESPDSAQATSEVLPEAPAGQGTVMGEEESQTELIERETASDLEQSESGTTPPTDTQGPTPEEMVDEELIQEVVEELLEDSVPIEEITSEPVSEPDPTTETVSEPTQ